MPRKSRHLEACDYEACAEAARRCRLNRSMWRCILLVSLLVCGSAGLDTARLVSLAKMRTLMSFFSKLKTACPSCKNEKHREWSTVERAFHLMRIVAQVSVLSPLRIAHEGQAFARNGSSPCQENPDILKPATTKRALKQHGVVD